ncbi:MAG: GyrI-like domain-containing protein [Rhodoblastus sp.]|nr:MAG: GyrI-like domain-containing protein [Rhodoblastus sp.]
MLTTPQIVTTQAQRAAVIRLSIARSEMMKTFGPAVAELRATLAAQGVRAAGPVFAHHLTMSDQRFDFQLGVVVDRAVTASGRVEPGGLPAAVVARAVYSGAYEGLSSAWGALMGWIKDAGREPAADLWEVYVVGPQTATDPADWRTELYRPLKG